MNNNTEFWAIIIIIYIIMIVIYIILRSRFVYEHDKNMYMHDYLFISLSTLMFGTFFTIIISENKHRDKIINSKGLKLNNKDDNKKKLAFRYGRNNKNNKDNFNDYEDKKVYNSDTFDLLNVYGEDLKKTNQREFIPNNNDNIERGYKLPDYKFQKLEKKLNTGVQIDGKVPYDYEGNKLQYDDQLNYNLYQDFYNNVNLDRDQFPDLLSYYDDIYPNYRNYEYIPDDNDYYIKHKIDPAQVLYTKVYDPSDPYLTPQQLAADPNHFYRDYYRHNNLNEAYTREVNDFKRRKIIKSDKRQNRNMLDNIAKNLYSDRMNYEDKNYWYDYE